jgi:hypothetical protein
MLQDLLKMFSIVIETICYYSFVRAILRQRFIFVQLTGFDARKKNQFIFFVYISFFKSYLIFVVVVKFEIWMLRNVDREQ